MKPYIYVCPVFIVTLCYLVDMKFSLADDSTSVFRGILLTRFGFYNQYGKCKPGQYVLGMRLKTKVHNSSESVNISRNEVTAIEFTCSDRISSATTRILHKIGKHGEWGEYFECESGFAVGILLEVHNWHSLYSADNYVENVELDCPLVATESFWQRYFNRLGTIKLSSDQISYKLTQSCGPNEAMSELRTIANSVTQLDTGEKVVVESIDVGCQNIPSPAVFCDYSFRWERLKDANCSSPSEFLNSTHDYSEQLNCTFNASLGFYFNKELNDFKNILISYNLDENIITPSERWLLFHKLLSKHYAHPSLKSARELNTIISILEKRNFWLISRTKNVHFVQTYSGLNRHRNNNIMSSPISARNSIQLQQEQIVRQFIGVCGVHKYRFNKFRTRRNYYFRTIIDKLPAKIVLLNNN